MMDVAKSCVFFVVLSVCVMPMAALGLTSDDVTASSVVINELMASNSKTIKDSQGQYEDWIELYNPGSSAVNVGGMYMTDDLTNPRKWQIPTTSPLATTIAAKGYLLIWADGDTADSGLHASFSLAVSGEEVGLFASDGSTLVDSVILGQQVGDISFGRFPDGSESWRYMGIPTPGTANIRAYEGVVEDVEFSQERGFHQSAFLLWLATQTSGATIYYTLDGSDPIGVSGQAVGAIYGDPIIVDGTRCVRAAAVKMGWLPSRTRTATYIFLADVIHQPASPAGFPATWGATRVDYAMDLNVVNAPAYAAHIQDDLKTIPSVAITMSNDDFFNASRGIYANPGATGVAWERAASIEWIDPVKQTNFQVNAGLRIQGGVGRSTSVAKHSFRILFKGAYGPSELSYPLFNDGDVQQFDDLVLRAIWNYSWFGDSTACSGLGTSHADYLRDLFCKNTVRDMDDLSPRGRPVHVYLNGLYWGMYILSERPDEGFSVDHMGGSKGDYDVLYATTSIEVKAGDVQAWNAMFSLAAKDLSNAQNYQAIQQYLDLPAMADYMLMVYLVGSRDAPVLLCNDTVPRNFYAIRKREPGGQFLFMPWDVEWSLEQTSVNRVNIVGQNNPHYLVSRLKNNPDFLMLMADRTYRFFFNNDALTPGQCVQRYGLLAQEIDRAIVGESARWGDSLRSTPYTRDDWVAERDRILTQYFPVRTGIVLDQLKQAGFYPSVSPPDFYVNGQALHGGHLPSGGQLSMQNANTGTSTIWYTLDGSDPRMPGSGAGAADTVLVAENAAKKAFVPTAAISDNWRGGAAFDDSAWISGSGGVGYERSTGYESYFTIDVGNQMYQKYTTCYIRIPFTVAAADIGTFSSLTLNMRCDDGFIAYINGVEVARKNFTGTPAWNSKASALTDDTDAIVLTPWTISDYLSSLHAGQNILAIQGLNESTTSSDFLISAELKATKGTGTPGGVSPTAVKYTAAVTLSATTVVKARVLSGTTWSALNEAVYAVGPVARNLRISEIMYHPLDSGDPNDPNAEYIELTNIGSAKINLNRVQFTKGITFVFPSVDLAPKAYTLVVKDLGTFKTKYGSNLPIAGQYSGSLSNAGERIRLEDAAGQVIEDLTYHDHWYRLTDGKGFSLTVTSPATADPNSFNDKSLWRPSAHNGGSPGIDDSGQVPELGAVVISELVANPGSGASDWIELYNTTDRAIDLSDWFLSDDRDDLTKYQVAAGTSITAHGYLVFTKSRHFGNPSDPGCHTPFGFSHNGETAYLHSGSAGVLTGYTQQESFGASETGVSMGRYSKSDGSYDFVELSAPTPGAANAAAKIGPIVVSEIMYNPTGDPDAEYVELLNIDTAAVTLYDPAVSTPWRFTIGDPNDPTAELLLPSDAPVTLQPGQRAVLTKNLRAFSWQYSVPTGVPVLEWGYGWLSKDGGQVQISKPADAGGHWIEVDRVVYSDGSHPAFGQSADPWPAAADGSGQSLTRTLPTAYGNDPANWHAATPSPGEN